MGVVTVLAGKGASTRNGTFWCNIQADSSQSSQTLRITSLLLQSPSGIRHNPQKEQSQIKYFSQNQLSFP